MATAYEKKRNLRETPEPSGDRRPDGIPGDGPIFVIQKHDASRLHYDFRLEHGGTLKSWAVPKGPSLNPSDKRLAVEVEDHPLEYGGFEGVIPKGNYGAGTVMVWDHGTWEPKSSNVSAALRKGSLKFTLHGEKLHGDWALVRMNAGGNGDSKPNWLLIKEKDRHAARGKSSLLEKRARSVRSGRSLEEIAQARERVWDSEEGEIEPEALSTSESPPPDVKPDDIPGSRARKSLPRDVSPELATLVSDAPDGDEWIHEIKFDGYRLLAYLEAGKTKLVTRGGKDWTKKFPETAEALAALKTDAAILDGEVVALDRSGVSRFEDLQQALSGRRTDKLVFYVFDLLFWNGRDLRESPLVERKRALRQLFADSGIEPKNTGPVRFSDHIAGQGRSFHARACESKLEGVIAKKADSVYRCARTKDWLKVKCGNRQEFVIGGFTDPTGSRVGFGSLAVGIHDEKRGTLRYAGRVGSGFDDQMLKDLHSRLKSIERKTPPFDEESVPAADRKGIHWVTPELVCEVDFTEWTRDGRLRHPVFRGLRGDKDPSEITRERPQPKPPSAGSSSAKKRKPSGKVKAKAKAKATSASRSSGGGTDDKFEVCGIPISSPGRIVYPDADLTKGEVAEYYGRIAERLLPHVANRPLSLIRCPQGREKACFYQKHFDSAMPKHVKTVRIKEKSGSANYVYVESAEGLISLIQYGVLEIHPWGARADDPDKPDLLIFDLDPDPGVEIDEVLGAGHFLRDVLEELGLPSFVKTSGGKGIHLFTKIRRGPSWEELKTFARAAAEFAAARAPGKFVTTASKAKRKGRIFIDYLRNGRGATCVAAFCTRARLGAPISAPLAWHEVRPGLTPDKYTVKNIFSRLSQLKSDPWEDWDANPARLPKPPDPDKA